MKRAMRSFCLATSSAFVLVSGIAWAQEVPDAAEKHPPSVEPKSPSGINASTNSSNEKVGHAPETTRGGTSNAEQPIDSPNVTTPSPTAANSTDAAKAGVKTDVAPAPIGTTVAVAQPAPSPVASPSFFNKIGIGKEGWLQVGALLQGWYDTQWRSNLVPPNTNRSTQSTFRMRRAELKLAGDIVKDVASFMVSFDPASTYKYTQTNYTVPNGSTTGTQTVTTYTPPGNTAALKLFWVSIKSPYVDAAIGQFKYPISYEGQTSSAELIFPERAYSTRYFGDTYDMGIRLEKKFDWVKYQVFLINGSGQNQVDTNLQKDLAVRLEFTPVQAFTFGGSGLASLWQRTTQATTKDKVEAFGRLNVSGLLIQGELLWGKTGSTAPGVERTKAAGRYATVGYTIAGRLQPVIRYGYLNTDKTVTLGQSATYALFSPFNLATDEVRSYEVGLNYYLQGNELKLQAAYGYYDLDNIPSLQEFTLAAQAAF